MKNTNTANRLSPVMLAIACTLTIISCTKTHEPAHRASASQSKAAAFYPYYIVTTYAGTGDTGSTDGTNLQSAFNAPAGGAIDIYGWMYIADAGNHMIRRIIPDLYGTSLGWTYRIAGNGAPGFNDGMDTAAHLHTPFSIAAGSATTIYLADQVNHRIRKVTTVAPASFTTTLAGSSTAGYKDGQGTEAKFKLPSGIATDRAGNVYVADQGNHRIRKVTPEGLVTTVAGSGTAGFADGQDTSARFNYPTGIAIDTLGNLYVADGNNNRIRKITPAGLVSTLAGDGTAGFRNGSAATAWFKHPTGVAVTIDGTVLVADRDNNRIRAITNTGTATNVITIAGSGIAGFADGRDTTAAFKAPSGVWLDQYGLIYVADAGNNRIRKLIYNITP